LETGDFRPCGVCGHSTRLVDGDGVLYVICDNCNYVATYPYKDLLGKKESLVHFPLDWRKLIVKKRNETLSQKIMGLKHLGKTGLFLLVALALAVEGVFLAFGIAAPRYIAVAYGLVWWSAGISFVFFISAAVEIR